DRTAGGLRIGNVSRIRLRHPRANLVAPGIQLTGKLMGQLGLFGDQVSALAKVLLQVVEFAPAVLVELDELVIAGANRSTRCSALVGIVRVVPVQCLTRRSGAVLQHALETDTVHPGIVRNPAEVEQSWEEIDTADRRAADRAGLDDPRPFAEQ